VIPTTAEAMARVSGRGIQFFAISAATRRLAGAAVLVAALLLSAPFGFAEDDPFAALPGSWSGDGTIAMSNGTKERIRCQATYRLQNPTTIDLRLNCSSDSYKFELQSETVASGQSIRGNWTELTRRVGGQLSGRASGSRLNLRAEGQTFSALLDMTTRGNTQSISIRSPGSEMQEVRISLARRGG
jgi:hypothetical protein